MFGLSGLWRQCGEYRPIKRASRGEAWRCSAPNIVFFKYCRCQYFPWQQPVTAPPARLCLGMLQIVNIQNIWHIPILCLQFMGDFYEFQPLTVPLRGNWVRRCRSLSKHTLTSLPPQSVNSNAHKPAPVSFHVLLLMGCTRLRRKSWKLETNSGEKTSSRSKPYVGVAGAVKRWWYPVRCLPSPWERTDMETVTISVTMPMVMRTVTISETVMMMVILLTCSNLMMTMHGRLRMWITFLCCLLSGRVTYGGWRRMITEPLLPF